MYKQTFGGFHAIVNVTTLSCGSIREFRIVAFVADCHVIHIAMAARVLVLALTGKILHTYTTGKILHTYT